MASGIPPASFNLFCIKCEQMFFCVIQTPQTFDLSVHNTFFQSASVQCVCSFAHLNLFLLLASLRYGFFFATLPRRPASRSRLLTVDVRTGVLQVPFNEAAR